MYFHEVLVEVRRVSFTKIHLKFFLQNVGPFRSGVNELMRVRLMISQNCMSYWSGTDMASNQYLNQCGPDVWHHKGQYSTMVSHIFVDIGWGKGLSPIRHKVFNSTKDDFFHSCPWGYIMMACCFAFYHVMRKIETTFCKMSFILFKSQWLNWGLINNG